MGDKSAEAIERIEKERGRRGFSMTDGGQADFCVFVYVSHTHIGRDAPHKTAEESCLARRQVYVELLHLCPAVPARFERGGVSILQFHLDAGLGVAIGIDRPAMPHGVEDAIKHSLLR